MTHHRSALAALALSVLAGCTTVDSLPLDRVGEATLRSASGTPLGSVQLLGHGDSLSLAVVATGIEPGQHGFHLHTTGKCEAPDFTSAGGHLNPGQKHHGTESSDGAHLGDLPNLAVGQNRSVSADFDLAGTRAALLADIFDADGTAVVIHADPDDYRSDPAGNAGKRIACGVITRL